MKEEFPSYNSPVPKRRICGIRVPLVEQRYDEQGRKYIEYVIQVKSNGQTLHVYRRYSEFFCLNEQLKLEHGIQLDFPQKRYWGNMDPTFVEKRRGCLEEYLMKLLDIHAITISTSDHWKEFLDPSIIKYGSDSSNPCYKSLSLSRESKSSGFLDVRIIEGRNFSLPNIPETKLELFSYFTFGEPDPSLSSCLSHQTKSVRGSVKPQWDFQKRISMDNLESESITFYVKTIGGELLGFCTCSLCNLDLEENPKDFWWKLSSQSALPFSCEIHVSLSFAQQC